MMVIVTGLPGSGKSYFARRLSKRLNLEYIGSDETRKDMEAMGKYGKEDKQQVYDRMEFLAEKSLRERRDLILDATFIKKNLRQQFIALALKRNSAYCMIWIEAAEELIKKRVSVKRDDSEADFQVYLKLSKEFESPKPPYLKLQSEQDNIDDLLIQAEKYIKTVS
jgi:predicted kinase